MPATDNPVILYLLSGNLSSTPRALKSLVTLDEEPFVLLVNRTATWKAYDLDLMKELGIRYVWINLWRRPIFPWLLATMTQQICRIGGIFLKNSPRISAFASNKSTILLNMKLRSLDIRLSGIRAHGYGALYPAWRLSVRRGIPFHADVEDFHPGELPPHGNSSEKARRELLMRTILPKASFVTFPSPGISRRSLEITGPLRGHNIILNSFPAGEFIKPAKKSGPLKMIWFSQKIGINRGLNLVFSALTLMEENNWELCLVGDAQPGLEESIPPSIRSFVRILPPLPQHELHRFLSVFDVGLALEVATESENRDLCLTNKLLAYAQAGLYILATNTSAQKVFIEEDPDRGLLCEYDLQEMKKALNTIQSEIGPIRAGAKVRYKKNDILSWEHQTQNLRAL